MRMGQGEPLQDTDFDHGEGGDDNDQGPKVWQLGVVEDIVKIPECSCCQINWRLLNCVIINECCNIRLFE